MTSISGFPDNCYVENHEVPDGYPLVCPFCHNYVPECLWCREIDDFMHPGYGLESPLMITTDGIFAVLTSPDHCLVHRLECVHRCQ